MRRVLPVVALLALLASSCGGGGDKKPSTPTSAPGTTAVIEVTTEPPTSEAPPETTIARGSPRPPTSQITTMGPGTARIVGTVTASIDPNPPIVGVPALLVVRFGSGSVDAEGRVVVTPRPGIRVQLNLGSGLALESLAIVVADGAGAAAWQVRCLQPGQFPAAILVGNASSSLLLPPCTAAPPPPAAAATTVP